MDIASLKIAAIKKMIGEPEKVSGELLSALARDPRAGVREIYLRLERLRLAGEAERRRLDALFHYEDELRQRGFTAVAGVDEAGRGPLAGPVVAAAVILPDRTGLFELNDSKKLTEAKRELLEREIKAKALAWSVGVSSVEEILAMNIHKAGLAAMRRAVTGLMITPDFVLVDGFAIAGLELPQLPLTGGDGKSASIAAASILAKVHRDKLMEEYHVQFPQYGFDRHKGYGTAGHLQALRRYGPCPIHRSGYGPVKAELEKRGESC
ncbi:MAG: ribonuclease HII [Firmicutes bacterium]|nr:ribonuclease HII [Bacillota bacterium]